MIEPNNEQSTSLDAAECLMASTRLSLEQKLDIKEHGCHIEGTRLVIHSSETIASPNPEKISKCEVMRRIYGLTKIQQKYYYFLICEKKAEENGKRHLGFFYSEKAITKKIGCSRSSITRANKVFIKSGLADIKSTVRGSGYNSVNKADILENIFYVVKGKTKPEICTKSLKEIKEENKQFSLKNDAALGQNDATIIYSNQNNHSYSAHEQSSKASEPASSKSKKRKISPEVKECADWLDQHLKKLYPESNESKGSLISWAKILMERHKSLPKAKSQVMQILKAGKGKCKPEEMGAWTNKGIRNNWKFHKPRKKAKPSPTPENASEQKKACQREFYKLLAMLPEKYRVQITQRFVAILTEKFKGDYKRMANATLSVLEQIEKGTEIKKPEAYLMSAVKKELKPKKHSLNQYQTMHANAEIARKEVPRLKTKEICIIFSKILSQDGKRSKLTYVAQRFDAEGNLKEQVINRDDPKAWEKIYAFEKEADAEKANAFANVDWLKMTLDRVTTEYSGIKLISTKTGFCLSTRAEMNVDGAKHLFRDFVTLNPSNSKKSLEGDLNGFLDRNKKGVHCGS